MVNSTEVSALRQLRAYAREIHRDESTADEPPQITSRANASSHDGFLEDADDDDPDDAIEEDKPLSRNGMTSLASDALNVMQEFMLLHRSETLDESKEAIDNTAPNDVSKEQRVTGVKRRLDAAAKTILSLSSILDLNYFWRDLFFDMFVQRDSPQSPDFMVAQLEKAVIEQEFLEELTKAALAFIGFKGLGINRKYDAKYRDVRFTQDKYVVDTYNSWMNAVFVFWQHAGFEVLQRYWAARMSLMATRPKAMASELCFPNFFYSYEHLKRIGQVVANASCFVDYQRILFDPLYMLATSEYGRTWPIAPSGAFLVSPPGVRTHLRLDVPDGGVIPLFSGTFKSLRPYKVTLFNRDGLPRDFAKLPRVSQDDFHEISSGAPPHYDFYPGALKGVTWFANECDRARQDVAIEEADASTVSLYGTTDEFWNGVPLNDTQQNNYELSLLTATHEGAFGLDEIDLPSSSYFFFNRIDSTTRVIRQIAANHIFDLDPSIQQQLQLIELRGVPARFGALYDENNHIQDVPDEPLSDTSSSEAIHIALLPRMDLLDTDLNQYPLKVNLQLRATPLDVWTTLHFRGDPMTPVRLFSRVARAERMDALKLTNWCFFTVTPEWQRFSALRSLEINFDLALIAEILASQNVSEHMKESLKLLQLVPQHVRERLVNLSLNYLPASTFDAFFRRENSWRHLETLVAHVNDDIEAEASPPHRNLFSPTLWNNGFRKLRYLELTHAARAPDGPLRITQFRPTFFGNYHATMNVLSTNLRTLILNGITFKSKNYSNEELKNSVIFNRILKSFPNLATLHLRDIELVYSTEPHVEEYDTQEASDYTRLVEVEIHVSSMDALIDMMRGMSYLKSKQHALRTFILVAAVKPIAWLSTRHEAIGPINVQDYINWTLSRITRLQKQELAKLTFVNRIDKWPISSSPDLETLVLVLPLVSKWFSYLNRFNAQKLRRMLLGDSWRSSTLTNFSQFSLRCPQLSYLKLSVDSQATYRLSSFQGIQAETPAVTGDWFYEVNPFNSTLYEETYTNYTIESVRAQLDAVNASTLPNASFLVDGESLSALPSLQMLETTWSDFQMPLNLDFGRSNLHEVRVITATPDVTVTARYNAATYGRNGDVWQRIARNNDELAQIMKQAMVTQEQQERINRAQLYGVFTKIQVLQHSGVVRSIDAQVAEFLTASRTNFPTVT